jgi:hypothetical protein
MSDPFDLSDLFGRRALITGSSKGIRPLQSARKTSGEAGK